METGFDTTVLNMNPEGWIQGVTNERTWVMLYGLDVCAERQLIIAGDNKGKVYFADARTNQEIAQHQLHKKGNKVWHRAYFPLFQAAQPSPEFAAICGLLNCTCTRGMDGCASSR